MKTSRKINSNILDGLKGLKDGTVEIGWFEDTKYSDGTSVAMVAEVQEFGATINVTEKMRGYFAANGFPLKKDKGQIVIPPRSFMRTTVDENQSEWKQHVKGDLAKTIENGGDTIKVLDRLGLEVKGDIQQKISSIQSPPLSGMTIEMRQRRKANGKTVGNLTKPLVEEGIMLNTIQSRTTSK